MRIGIFAGTFDPVHNGHLAFAETAIAKTHLEKVIIIAEKNPYRKRPHATWDHRQAMIERITQEVTAVDHDYQFAAKLAHQHTMGNLLEVAGEHYGADNNFWFLVGSDIFEHMHEWRDITHQHQYGGFVVALRDGHSKEWFNQKLAILESHGIHINYELVDNTKPHVSSSAIRQAIQSSWQVETTTPAVVQYITTHQLYRNQSQPK